MFTDMSQLNANEVEPCWSSDLSSINSSIYHDADRGDNCESQGVKQIHELSRDLPDMELEIKPDDAVWLKYRFFPAVSTRTHFEGSEEYVDEFLVDAGHEPSPFKYCRLRKDNCGLFTCVDQESVDSSANSHVYRETIRFEKQAKLDLAHIPIPSATLVKFAFLRLRSKTKLGGDNFDIYLDVMTNPVIYEVITVKAKLNDKWASEQCQILAAYEIFKIIGTILEVVTLPLPLESMPLLEVRKAINPRVVPTKFMFALKCCDPYNYSKYAKLGYSTHQATFAATNELRRRHDLSETLTPWDRKFWWIIEQQPCMSFMYDSKQCYQILVDELTEFMNSDDGIWDGEF